MSIVISPKAVSSARTDRQASRKVMNAWAKIAGALAEEFRRTIRSVGVHHPTGYMIKGIAEPALGGKSAQRESYSDVCWHRKARQVEAPSQFSITPALALIQPETSERK